MISQFLFVSLHVGISKKWCRSVVHGREDNGGGIIWPVLGVDSTRTMHTLLPFEIELFIA